VDRVAQLRDEMRAGLELVEAVKQPMPIGDAWWVHRLDPFDGSSVVLVGPNPDQLDRVLLRSRDLPGPRPTIEWVVPSPTGAHLAVGISVDGGEDATARVIDVASGAMLPDAVPHVFVSPVSWLADGSGFYARVSDRPMVDGIHPRVALHHLGGVTEHDDALAGAPKSVVVLPSGDTLVVEGLGPTLTPTAIKRPGSDRWQPLLEPDAGNLVATVRGDDLVGITTIGADRGRVVSIPIDTAADRGTWTELVPESDGVARGMVPLDEHLVTCEIVNGAHRIRVFAADGTPDHTVDLPEPSGLDLLFGLGRGFGDPHVLPDGPASIVFHLGGFDRPPCPHRYDLTTRELTPLMPVVRDERIVATWHRAASADGHQVGSWHVRLRGTEGPAPALVYGYGGFNVAMHTPCHPTPLMPWLERGGCLLLPQLRGGGEEGLAHYRAALALGKQRTFDDLFAVAEHAVATGIAAAGRLAFVGASNGGLTAGAAVTQRPELFSAVICAIPAIDLLDLPEHAVGSIVTEYGRADVPEHVAEWRRISPLQQLREGVEYPAVLVDQGEVDIRCPPERSRRFAERLSEIAGPTGRRVVLRERPHGGHVAGEGELWPVWLDFAITEVMERDR
jgi:prolyl oligopeptidase